MKLKFYSFYSKLISFCLVLLGFPSCSNSDDPVDEYGSPSAKFKVLGKVTSTDNNKNPIKNIRVVMIEDVKESENEYVQGDTVYTNTDGKFEINRHNFPFFKFLVKFQDIDGEANGGLFEEKIEKIEFKNSDFQGKGHWYIGEATKDMGTIELSAKEETEQ